MDLRAVVVAADGKLHVTAPPYGQTLCGLATPWPGLSVSDFSVAIIAASGPLCKTCVRVIGSKSFWRRMELEDKATTALEE